MRAGEEINLNSADLKLARFEYNITTQTKGERKTDTTHNSNNNYFVLDIANDPNQYYLMLREWDEETNNEILHEFKTPVIGTKRPGQDSEITLYLEVADDQAGGGNETGDGLIGTIIEILTDMKDFFTGFLEKLGEGLKYALVPEKEFLPEWSENMLETVEEKVPILHLPLKLLKTFFEDNEAYFENEENAYLRWDALKWNNYEIIPAGSINFFDDIINKHEAFKNLRQYTVIFTNFIFYLYFAKYISKKIKIIFGNE